MQERVKEFWSDPEFRKMQSEKMQEQNKEFWSDPEYRKMQSEKMQERWSDPEFRKMQSEKMQERWSNPEYRKNHIERNRKRVEKSIIKVIEVNNLMECGLNLTHSLKIAQISKDSFYKYRKYISLSRPPSFFKAKLFIPNLS